MDMTAVERFWTKLATNADYQAAFRNALPERPSPSDLAAFASRSGFALSPDDFLRHARSHTIRAVVDDFELSDDVLDAVSGGGSEDSYASMPLQLDIYATWDGLDALPRGGGATTPPPKP